MGYRTYLELGIGDGSMIRKMHPFQTGREIIRLIVCDFFTFHPKKAS